MLCVKRDNLGRIEAALEVRLVNEAGCLDPEGRWAFVEQIEVSPGCHVAAACRYFIDYYATWMPTANWCYWVRRDKTGTKIHGSFSRPQVERFVNQRKGGMANATV